MLRISALLLLLAAGLATQGQPVVRAKCSTGTIQATKQISGILIDTIAVACAQSIYAFEVTNKNAEAEKYEVMAFQLSVREGNDTTVLYGNTINSEMKARLARIQPGAKIFFEGIRVKSSEFGYRTTEPLGFVVK